MLSALSNLIRPLIMVLAVSSVGAFVYGYNKIVDLSEKNEELRAKVTQLTETNERNSALIEKYKLDLQKTIEDLNLMAEDFKRIERIRREQETALRSAIGRQDVVWERPTLVERMLQRNWKAFTDKISCETGAEERCE